MDFIDFVGAVAALGFTVLLFQLYYSVAQAQAQKKDSGSDASSSTDDGAGTGGTSQQPGGASVGQTKGVNAAATRARSGCKLNGLCPSGTSCNAFGVCTPTDISLARPYWGLITEHNMK